MEVICEVGLNRKKNHKHSPLRSVHEENGYLSDLQRRKEKEENQVKAIRNLILRGGLYRVDPIVETGWESVLRRRRKPGIP